MHKKQPFHYHGKKLPGLDKPYNELSSVYTKVTKKRFVSSSADRNVDEDEIVSRKFNNDKSEGENVKTVDANESSFNDVSAMRGDEGEDFGEKNVNDKENTCDLGSEDEQEIDEEYFSVPQSQSYYFSTRENFEKDDDSSELQSVIKELITTEERYIEKLRIVVEQYTSIELKHGNKFDLFGNIEDLYEECVNFLAKLQQNTGNVRRIMHTFINAKSTLFNLYIQYLESRVKASECYDINRDTIEVKDRELQNDSNLLIYLTIPFIRLTHYKTFFERIQRIMMKSSESYDNSVQDVINVVHETMNYSQDLMSLRYLKFGKLNVQTSGLFIMCDEFNILKPAKYNAIIFLFEKNVVFTKVLTEDSLAYMDEIKVSDLSLTKIEHEGTIFNLTDHSKTVIKAKPLTYILEAKCSDIKNKWIHKIETMLWKEFDTEKKQQKQQEKF